MITTAKKTKFVVGDKEFDTIEEAQAQSLSNFLPAVIDDPAALRESIITTLINGAEPIITILKFKGRKPREAKAKSTASAPKPAKAKTEKL